MEFHPELHKNKAIGNLHKALEPLLETFVRAGWELEKVDPELHALWREVFQKSRKLNAELMYQYYGFKSSAPQYSVGDGENHSKHREVYRRIEPPEQRLGGEYNGFNIIRMRKRPDFIAPSVEQLEGAFNTRIKQ